MSGDERYNVLIVMSDEQRADTLGCYGNSVARTRAIDALAEDGTAFDSCFTSYPLCCPSRASLWTALLPHRNHCIGNWRLVRPELRAGGLVSSFREAGYHTMYTGKWHVPGTTPSSLGFSDQAAIPVVENGQDRGRWIQEYRDWLVGLGYTLVAGHRENLTPADNAKRLPGGHVHCGTSDIPLEHYLDTWQTDRFIEQLDRKPDDSPFFAVCSYNPPHFPMIVPHPYDRLHDPETIPVSPNFLRGLRGKPQDVLESDYYRHTKDLSEDDWRRLIAHYWGFCSLVDDAFARIVTHLKASGEYDRTIIVFVSDHGDMIGSHALNHKGYEMHYEEVIRVPLIIRFPDGANGARRHGIVALHDLIPTVADLCGVRLPDEAPDGHPLDGKSFAELLAPEADRPHREYVITETYDHCHEGKGTYLDPEAFSVENRLSMITSIRTRDEKFVFHWDAEDEYYDLRTDPYENENRLSAAVQLDASERAAATVRCAVLLDRMLDEISRTGVNTAEAIRKRTLEKLPM